MPSAQSSKLLVSFGATDARHAVARKTVKRMAKQLGLPAETQVVQYALAQLRDTLLPSYEKDEGEVSERVLGRIRRSVDQEMKGGKSLFRTKT